MSTQDARNDGELLADYLGSKAAEPFEELIRRHGAVVLGVCRRVLGSSPDADDALQATFLTLIAKGASLRKRESLAGWLYQVAWNISRRARKANAKRRRHEQEVGAMRQGHENSHQEVWAGLRDVLDEELNALPGNYREVILLHYGEGRSLEDTARTLSSNAGTISTWLHRGKELLGSRLARRGLVLSAGMMVTMIAKNAAAEEVSAVLASAVLSNAATGAMVSPQVAALSKGALKAMFYAKMKVAAAIAVAGGVVGSGAGIVAHRLLAAEPPGKIAVVAPPGETKGPPEAGGDKKPAPDKADDSPAPDANVKPPPDPNAPVKVKPPPDYNAPAKVKSPPDPNAPAKVKLPPDPNAPTKVKEPPDYNAPAKVKEPPDYSAPAKVKPPPDPNAPAKVKPPPDPNAPAKIKPPPDPDAPKYVKPGTDGTNTGATKGNEKKLPNASSDVPPDF